MTKDLRPELAPLRPPSIFSRTFRSVFRLAFAVDINAALSGLGWTLKGKRVRGWNRLCVAAATNPFCYRKWTMLSENTRIDRFGLEWPLPGSSNRYHCLIWGDNDLDEVKTGATIASLQSAFGDRAIIWCPAPGIDAAEMLEANLPLAIALERLRLRAPDAGWVLPIRAGDLIASRSAEILQRVLMQADDTAICYWDEDVLTGAVRGLPWIKPDWDPLLHRARDLLTGSSLFNLDRAINPNTKSNDLKCDGAGIAALLSSLATVDPPCAPLHLPFLLTHRTLPLPAPHYDLDGIAGEMENARHAATSHARTWVFREVCPADPARWPSVSIIIPTRDGHDLLKKCFASLCAVDYPGELEILIVDNDSVDPQTLALLDAYRVGNLARILQVPGDFNFAVLNNRAADVATGAILCLLNNDVEALDGNWLTAMVRHAVADDVGAVGAQLLYPDGAVQHAGVVIGLGGAAGHFGKAVAPDSDEYASWFGVTRRVSAVTAACMVVRRDRYLAVGGLDEQAFPVAFNDVDFCLKLDRRGWRNIYVAQARLVHHESRSRGIDTTPQKAARFAQELAALDRRWHTADYRDPYFSPLFSRTSERCVLEFRA